MNGDWRLTRLGDVLRSVSRPVRLSPDRTYRLVGAHWYAKGLYVKEQKSGGEIQARTLFQIKEGDFVYNRLFAWKGSFAVASKAVDGCFVSNEFPCFVALDGVDPRFLWFYFSRSSAWSEALGLSSGSTPTSRNRLKEQQFLNMEVRLPPIDEQRRVVARVEKLATRQREARAFRDEALTAVEKLMTAEAETRFRALTASNGVRMFSDFAPHVTSGPRNWAAHYSDSGTRFYRAQDIGADFQIAEGSKVYVSTPANGQAEGAKLQPGDLMLVITGATVGRCTVFPSNGEPGLVNQHVALCRFPKESVIPEYVLWGLRSEHGQEQLLGQRYGQGKPGLNLSNIRSLELPFPSIEVQRRTIVYLDSFHAKVECLRKHQSETAAELDALMPSILSKAFRGELL